MCWRCLDTFFSFCRDIKPANVMIADDGSPVLMDLGSANLARVEISNAKISRQLQVLLLVLINSSFYIKNLLVLFKLFYFPPQINCLLFVLFPIIILTILRYLFKKINQQNSYWWIESQKPQMHTVIKTCVLLSVHLQIVHKTCAYYHES